MQELSSASLMNRHKVLSELPETCEVFISNVDELTHNEYAKARMETFGASDSSSILDVNPYKSREKLVAEKLKGEVIELDKAIVRKGYDLEDYILSRYIKETGKDTFKPPHMYKYKELPFLTCNFDGLCLEQGHPIPVEIKLVSRFGEKYWNKNAEYGPAVTKQSKSYVAHITKMAEQVGIPAYYYTQVQQQILLADAPYAYLYACFDESWSFKEYKIMRDDFMITDLIFEATKAYGRYTKLKERN